jgi:outer membrane receptor protein involved in Fe transport
MVWTVSIRGKQRRIGNFWSANLGRSLILQGVQRMAAKQQNQRFSQNTLSLAVAVALGMPSSMLTAQHALAQESGRLMEEVVITATRRANDLQDIPLNISAVTADQMAELQLNNVLDLSKWVPGLTVLDQGVRAGNPIIVRGLNTNSFDEPRGPGGTVGTYIGDIPVYIDLNLNEIERVEALIGPQGTLYGAGTLGGAIRYIPKAVDLEEFGAELRGGLSQNAEGDSPGWETGVVLNLPLMDGQLGVRASYNVEEVPGFIDYVYTLREPGVSNPQPDFGNPAEVAANLRSVDDANNSRIDSGKIALRYTPSELFDATLTYFYQEQESGGRSLVHYYPDVASADNFQTGKYDNGYRYEEPLTRKDQLISLEVTSDVGFADVVLAAGLSESDQLGQRDATDLLLNFEFGYEDFPSFSAFTRDDVSRENTTVELRMVSTHEGPLNWIVGYFYNEATLDQDIREFVPGLPEFSGVNRPDELELIQTREGKTTENAFFGELGYQVTDNWQVTVGARYYDYDDELEVLTALPYLFTSIGIIGPDDIPLRGPTNTSSDSGSLYKFNTSYTFSDELMMYFTLSEGYRRGGINPVAPCDDGPSNVCGQPDEIKILPDTTTNYELGLRSELYGGRLALSAALYQVDWEDIQIQDFTEVGAARITSNGGKAESKGLELSLRGQLTDQWAINANYSYTNAELTSFAPGLVGREDGEPGDRLAGSPEHAGAVGATYSTVVANGLDLAINYNIVYTGDIYSTTGLRNNGEKLSSYTTHGLSGTLSGDRWTASLFATNLTNEYAVTGVRNNPSFLRDVNGFDLRFYGRWINMPRTIGAQVTYRF